MRIFAKKDAVGVPYPPDDDSYPFDAADRIVQLISSTGKVVAQEEFNPSASTSIKFTDLRGECQIVEARLVDTSSGEELCASYRIDVSVRAYEIMEFTLNIVGPTP